MDGFTRHPRRPFPSKFQRDDFQKVPPAWHQHNFCAILWVLAMSFPRRSGSQSWAVSEGKLRKEHYPECSLSSTGDSGCPSSRLLQQNNRLCALKNRNVFLTILMFGSQKSTWLNSIDGCLLDFRLWTFPCILTWLSREGMQVLSMTLLRALNPFMRVLLSWPQCNPNYLPKATTTFQGRTSTYEFWGGHIHP